MSDSKCYAETAYERIVNHFDDACLKLYKDMGIERFVGTVRLILREDLCDQVANIDFVCPNIRFRDGSELTYDESDQSKPWSWRSSWEKLYSERIEQIQQALKEPGTFKALSPTTARISLGGPFEDADQEYHASTNMPDSHYQLPTNSQLELWDQDELDEIDEAVSICGECKGTGVYRGLDEIDDCKTCGGKGCLKD